MFTPLTLILYIYGNCWWPSINYKFGFHICVITLSVLFGDFVLHPVVSITLYGMPLYEGHDLVYMRRDQ